MSFIGEPPRGTLARYLPQDAEKRYVEGSSFRLGEDESLKGVWRVMRKQKMVIAVGGLCGLLLALLACLVISRQYAGVATIQVGKEDASQTSLLRNVVPASPSTEELKTDITTDVAMLRSDSVLLAVVKDLDLQKHRPFAYRPTLLGFLDGANSRIKAEQGLPLEEAPATRDRILKIFSRKLQVQNVPDTRLITVTYLSPDPKLAADISNTVVKEFVSLQSRTQATADADRWLANQLAELKKNVETTQSRLADFEQQTGLNSMLLGAIGQGAGGGSTHVPALDRLDVLNQELTAAQSNRLTKEAIYHLTQTQNPEVVAGLSTSLPANTDAAVAVKGSGLELLQSLRQQQSALRLTYADMATKYGAKNQHMLETQNQLVSLDKQVAEELVKINARARNDFLLARQNENDIRQAFEEAQREAGKLNASTVQLQVLTQEAAASRQLYDALYGKLKEVDIQAGLRATNIGIMDPANPPASPTRPNPPLYLAIGLVAGLFAGLSSALVREHFDDTVNNATQLNSRIRLPVLGNIPYAEELRWLSDGSGGGKISSETSPLVTDRRSVGAEAYRALRTSIMISSAAGRLRSLLVTSPVLGEGKTTVAYNTAVAFAQAGKNVVLVDADMRKPHLHDIFSVPNAPGLSDVLTGAATVDQAMHKHPSVPSLSLLTAGSDTSMPAELLSSKALDELLVSLGQKYELIIVDSPPMLLVTDARILAGKLDATLAVIRAGKTSGAVLQHLSEMLESSGSRAVGLVLNGIDTKSVDYYEAYGHDAGGDYYNA
ncbi:MAG TPA: polysaccharide biosynthesis tyrosine autokinase [Acidisarcina sp.]|nr:polysaccharide biosynthesis tyrosine autokinase [Acidisarcina sp.]